MKHICNYCQEDVYSELCSQTVENEQVKYYHIGCFQKRIDTDPQFKSKFKKGDLR